MAKRNWYRSCSSRSLDSSRPAGQRADQGPPQCRPSLPRSVDHGILARKPHRAAFPGDRNGRGSTKSLGRRNTTNQTKPYVIVAIRGVVPVAIGAAAVPRMIVPGAAAEHAALTTERPASARPLSDCFLALWVMSSLRLMLWPGLPTGPPAVAGSGDPATTETLPQPGFSCRSRRFAARRVKG